MNKGTKITILDDLMKVAEFRVMFEQGKVTQVWVNRRAIATVKKTNK